MTTTPEPEPEAPVMEGNRCPGQADYLLSCFRRAFNHDLPNHLVAIEGLLRVLEQEEGDRLSPSGRDYLQRIFRSAEKAHNLVHALAVIGRADVNRLPSEPVEWEKVCQEGIAEVKQLSPTGTIEYHLVRPSATLRLPRASLLQVLVQLLLNAVHASRGRPAPRIELGARWTSLGQEFWVADNAGRLSAELGQQLEAFFAGQEITPRWSGLGLVLVRQTVASWGGWIHVQAKAGESSCFTVVVPTPGLKG